LASLVASVVIFGATVAEAASSVSQTYHVWDEKIIMQKDLDSIDVGGVVATATAASTNVISNKAAARLLRGTGVDNAVIKDLNPALAECLATMEDEEKPVEVVVQTRPVKHRKGMFAFLCVLFSCIC
jgi:hypothetical protein